MATDSIEELYVISTFNNKVQFQAEDSSFTNKFLTNLEFANMNGEFKIGTSLCKEYNGYLLQVLDGDDSKMLNAMTTLETDTLYGVFATEIIVRGGNCHDGCPLLFTDSKTVDKSRLNIQYFIEPRFTYFSDPFSSGYYWKYPAYDFVFQIKNEKKGFLGFWYGAKLYNNYKIDFKITHACNITPNPYIASVYGVTDKARATYERRYGFANQPVLALVDFEPEFCLKYVRFSGSRTKSPYIALETRCNR